MCDISQISNRELQIIKKKYPHIRCSVVLAYYPAEKLQGGAYDETLYPCGIEKIPYRYAISWRNKWMIEHADFLIAYVTGELGHAAKFLHWATKKGVEVLNLYD